MSSGAPSPSDPASGAPYVRLVLLGALIGVPAALLAAAFLALVHAVEDALWSDSPAWYAVIGLPVVGAGVVIVARALLPGDGGHPPLKGIGGGVMPLSYAPGIALAALGTLAFGAVLGPEAPLIALGTLVGVAATKLARAGEREASVLGTAGASSAISALFGGPLVAGMMMLEGSIGLGAAALPLLLPGLVAAAVGYTLFVGLGDWGGLSSQALAVPGLPAYDGTSVPDLVLAVAVGVVAALLIAQVRRGAARIEGERRVGWPVLLLLGGLAVGVVAELTQLLGDDSQDILFSGQAAVPAIVAEDSVGLVLLVLLAKAIAYGISLGCGFRGGPVFPAIFLGIGLAAISVVALGTSPTVAVAIGAAAGMAAGTRLLITSVLFAGLLVGHAGLDAVPAAVLAAAAAWITAGALERRSA